MPRKPKTKMGEIHHRYVWYDDSSKQSGGGQASISQRHLGSDVLTRICSEKRAYKVENVATDVYVSAYPSYRVIQCCKV